MRLVARHMAGGVARHCTPPAPSAELHHSQPPSPHSSSSTSRAIPSSKLFSRPNQRLETPHSSKLHFPSIPLSTHSSSFSFSSPSFFVRYMQPSQQKSFSSLKFNFFPQQQKPLPPEPPTSSFRFYTIEYIFNLSTMALLLLLFLDLLLIFHRFLRLFNESKHNTSERFENDPFVGTFRNEQPHYSVSPTLQTPLSSTSQSDQTYPFKNLPYRSRAPHTHCTCFCANNNSTMLSNNTCAKGVCSTVSKASKTLSSNGVTNSQQENNYAPSYQHPRKSHPRVEGHHHCEQKHLKTNQRTARDANVATTNSHSNTRGHISRAADMHESGIKNSIFSRLAQRKSHRHTHRKDCSFCKHNNHNKHLCLNSTPNNARLSINAYLIPFMLLFCVLASFLIYVTQNYKACVSQTLAALYPNAKYAYKPYHYDMLDAVAGVGAAEDVWKDGHEPNNRKFTIFDAGRKYEETNVSDFRQHHTTPALTVFYKGLMNAYLRQMAVLVQVSNSSSLLITL